MANTIRIRRSATASAVPTTGQLALGELAVNTTDGKLFLKKDVSGTQSIVEVGAIATGSIVDASISATAEIAVSKLADGAARQLLQTDAAGTGVEWTSNVDIPGTLDVTSTATFDSTISFPLGTAALPSIYPGTDTNTGLWSPAADTLAVSTAGSERLRITSTGNVGIGATPTEALQVANGNILIGTGGSLAGYRALYFGGTTATGRFAYIEKNNDSPFDFNIVAQTSLTAASAINFKTTPTSTAATIDSSGRFGIGIASPGSALDVKGTLRLSGATSGYVGLAPAAAAGSTTYTLPTADGANGNCLKTNGSGTLSWGVAGATGGGSDDVFIQNGQTVTTNYTLTAGKNAVSAGPITINNGITVTVPSGASWVIV